MMCRRFAAALVMALGLSAPASAAVTLIDSTGNVCSGGSSVTASGVALSSGYVADVTIAWRDNAGQTLSSVTFNGSATGVTENIASYSGGDRVQLVSYRVVGQTGTADVVATFSAAPSSGCAIRVSWLSGVDNTTPIGTPAAATALGTSATALSTSVTLASGDLTMVAVALYSNATSLAQDSGQTQIYPSVDSGEITTATSSETGSGSIASGYTWATGGDWARLTLVPYKASAGGGGGTPSRLLLLGVGDIQ